MNPRRPLRLGAACGLASTIAAATTAFLLTGAGQHAQPGPAPCSPDTIIGCIPNLPSATVVSTLQEHGYQCVNERGNTWNCHLRRGAAKYQAFIGHDHGLISRITATVHLDAPAEPGASTLAFLQWLATLPFAEDNNAAAEINTWVARQLTERTDRQAHIGRGYLYRLQASQPGRIELDVIMEVQ